MHEIFGLRSQHQHHPSHAVSLLFITTFSSRSQLASDIAMESSRIFVRGLPPKFTEDDVRKHFAKFPITDVKFFPHRRIGYVGYKTPEDAAKAVKYFNKSFIKLTRINAEIARPVCALHAESFWWR